jgi:hypothetical protein
MTATPAALVALGNGHSPTGAGAVLVFVAAVLVFVVALSVILVSRRRK